jgi:hypothetical protein
MSLDLAEKTVELGVSQVKLRIVGSKIEKLTLRKGTIERRQVCEQ